jgi:hypothetical protein
MMSQKIVQEIDETLDQLIQNAEVLSHVSIEELTPHELDAFQKTQESLLHQFLRLDASLSKTPRLIQKKTARFEKLKKEVHRKVSEQRERRAMRSKRRCKRLFV